jgi:hypothetical protein
MSQTDALTRATRNQARSLDAFMARHAAVATLLERLTAASADHFGADPERVLWAEASSLARVEELLAEAAAFIGA